MKALFSHYILRLMQNKKNLILYLCLTIGSIMMAIVLSSQKTSFAHVAVLQDSSLPSLYQNNVDIQYVTSYPDETDLITKKYDAVVEMKNQQLSIHSYKNDKFCEQLLYLLTNSTNTISNKQHTGETIFGFMMMFVMMEALFYTTLYGEDKDTRMLKRIGLSGFSIIKYLIVHSGMSIFLSFGSTWLVLFVAKMFNIDIGMSLGQYAILIFILTVFATAFAMMMNSLLDRESTGLTASSLIVLTSLLSGTFYSFVSEDGIIGLCIRFLPQKVFMDFASHINHLTSTQWMGVGYIGGMIFVFLIIALVMTKKSIIIKS